MAAKKKRANAKPAETSNDELTTEQSDESVWERARRIADEEGENIYDVLERGGTTREEIRATYLDMYHVDRELDAYLDETDMSLTDEEAGLTADGEPEDA
jgi:hypothetical protein